MDDAYRKSSRMKSVYLFNIHLSETAEGVTKDTKLYADITLEISAETMRKPKVQKAQASISQAKGQGRTRTLRNQWAAGSVFIFRAGGFLMGFGKGKSFSGSGSLQRGGGSGENGRKNLCC